MRLLLDTHAFLWWLDGDRRLSLRARETIDDAPERVHVSAASAWEIATKFRLGKLPGAAVVAANITACIRREGFVDLAVTIVHGQRAGGLPGPLRDPFDRMLIAQAISADLVLVSNEDVFDRYGVARLW